MSAQVLAITNNKGGVGKTMIATNIGAYFALKGYNTLLIDLDGQANLTDAFFAQEEVEHTIAESLSKKKALPIKEIRQHLSIIPSAEDTTYLEEKELQRLHSAIEPLLSIYDFIIIDTPPSKGEHTISALCCANGVIIPMQAEVNSLKGLYSIKRLIADVQRVNTSLQVVGIVLNFSERRRKLSQLCRSILAETYPSELCESTIRKNAALAEAILEREDIFSYDSKSNGAKDFEALSEELLHRLNQLNQLPKLQ